MDVKVRNIVTIQKTSRWIKALRSCSTLGIYLACAMFIFGPTVHVMELAWLLLFLCFLGYSYARVARWWYND